jgi:hypothetical protein
VNTAVLYEEQMFLKDPKLKELKHIWDYEEKRNPSTKRFDPEEIQKLHENEFQDE